MRDRNKFSNRKRGPQPSQSTDRPRLGEDPRLADGRKRRRDRKSSGVNLLAFLGFGRKTRDHRRSSAPVAPSRRQPVAAGAVRSSNNNRLVNLPQRPAGRSTTRAAVIPFDRQPPVRQPRRGSRRSAAPVTPPKNLVQLPSPRSKSGKLMLYAARLMVLGVGIGVLAGTMLSVWDPATRLTPSATGGGAPIAAPVKVIDRLQLGQELVDLKAKVVNLPTLISMLPRCFPLPARSSFPCSWRSFRMWMRASCN
jgi:beta-lactamase class A